mgnify:CR=1 FL=1
MDACRGRAPCAIVPPISAAAMLSRKLDRTNTMTSSTKPPFQSSGRKRGAASPVRDLSSKCFGQQREAQQQAEQVGEDHPFVGEMRDEAGGARAFRKKARTVP